MEKICQCVTKIPHCNKYGYTTSSRVLREIFEIRRIAPEKIIIIRHPHSVHGSPIWLLLGVSRHGWPARPYYQSDYRVEQSLPHHPQQCLLRMGQVLCVPTQKVRKGSNEVWTKLLYSVALCNILRSCMITINIIIAIVIACCFVFIVYMITSTNWGRVTHICVSEQGHHCFGKWLVA